MTSAAQQWQEDFERAREDLASLSRSGDEWQASKLGESVDALAERLSLMEARPVDFAVGRGELARRREALDALCREAMSARGATQMGMGGATQMGMGVGGGAVERGGKNNGMPMSRLDQQRETMRDHDRMLADLSRGVGRLKTQSALINEETSLHVRLLDDMEGDAERASSGLLTEARRAERVREKSKTFNLYAIIVVLSIILAVLVFSGL